MLEAQKGSHRGELVRHRSVELETCTEGQFGQCGGVLQHRQVLLSERVMFRLVDSFDVGRNSCDV